MLALDLDTKSVMPLLDISKLCRVCRDESDCMLDLFAESFLPNEEKEPSLALMLSECSSCHMVRADGFPQFICVECAKATRQAFRLRQQCRLSMQYFSQLRGMVVQPDSIKEPDSEDVGPSQETSKAMEPTKAEKEAFHGDESNLEPLIVELVASQCPGLESPTKENTDTDLSSETISVGSTWEAKNTRAMKRIKYNSSSSEDSWSPPLTMKTSKEVKNFQCPHCMRSFTQKGNLQTHIRIHTGERPFKCAHCPQTFRQHGHLDVHLRRHSAQKRFKCAYCSYSCNQSVSLKKHIKTVHRKLQLKEATEVS